MIYKYIKPQRNLKSAMFYKCGILDPAPIHTCGEKVNYVMVSNKSLLIFKVCKCHFWIVHLMIYKIMKFHKT